MKTWRTALLALALMLALSVSAYAQEGMEWTEFDGEWIDLSVKPRPPEGEASVAYGGEVASAVELMQRDIVEKLNQVGPDVEFSIVNRLGYELEKEEYWALYMNALFNYPEETYWARTQFSYGGNRSRLYFKGYAAVDRDDASYTAAVDAAYAACISEAMTPVEKVVSAHDYLAASCQYDPYVGYGSKDYTAIDGTVYGENPAVYTSYGAFVDGNCVCQGYALAMKVLMDRAEVPCCLATSDAMNHAWNMVELNGIWYHLDVTWDDPIFPKIGDLAGTAFHEHLLLSDEEITALDHLGWTTENSVSCPSAYGGSTVWKSAGETPVFLDTREQCLYVMQGTDLAAYPVGGGFSSGSTVSSPTGAVYSAAYDDESGTYFYAASDGKVYGSALWESPLQWVYLGDTGGLEAGIAFGRETNIAEAKTLSAKFDYSTVWNCLLNVRATDPNMPVQVAWSYTLTDAASARGQYLYVRNTTGNPVRFDLYAAFYRQDGRMLRIDRIEGFTLEAEAGLETEQPLGEAPAGACEVKLFALADGVPVSESVYNLSK